jgi:hypothetical protein
MSALALHEWASPNKSWVLRETPCTESEKLLFARCTTISLGNGRKADFWNSTWFFGQCPKDSSPLLYNIMRC